MKTKNSESGQAIVLIVLAMIALLGFTALAVDGSMVYSDRRWAQNVSDSSALAASGTAAQNMELRGYIYRVGDPWGGGSCPATVNSAIALGLPAGVARAAENDYNLPNPLAEETGGIMAECVWDGPLPYLDFTAVVKKTTDAAFSQFIFSGLLENTTTAVARVQPSTSVGYGRSIVALDPEPCQGSNNTYGLQFGGMSGGGGGGNYLDIIDGGIFSNGCLDVDSNNANITIVNGSAEYYSAGNSLDAIHIDGGEKTQLVNTEYRMSASAYTLPYGQPRCDIEANQYTADVFFDDPDGDSVVELSDGLYCIQDDDGHGPGENVTINAGWTLTGSCVTIVMVDGSLTINGDPTIMLNAPETGNTSCGDALPGLLFYVPEDNPNCDENTNCLTLNGGSTSVFNGTILAPDTEVTFDGNAGARLFGQIIGWDVNVRGSSASTVTYNPNTEIVLPTKINVQK